MCRYDHIKKNQAAGVSWRDISGGLGAIINPLNQGGIMSNLLIYNDRVNKRIHVDRIYPALWSGDAATVTITSYDKRYDARLRITDGSAALLPWPVSHPSRIFHNEHICDEVHHAYRRDGGGQ